MVAAEAGDSRSTASPSPELQHGCFVFLSDPRICPLLPPSLPTRYTHLSCLHLGQDLGGGHPDGLQEPVGQVEGAPTAGPVMQGRAPCTRQCSSTPRSCPLPDSLPVI
jgi:hypothetical protein